MKPKLRVAICHNAVASDARADESDVLVQVAVVQSALIELGHTVEVVPVDLDLKAMVRRLAESAPDVVFNLVESVAESDRLASLAVGVIEELGIPITGSSAMALWVTNHKTLAKERLRLLGLPTPDWYQPNGSAAASLGAAGDPEFADTQFILKPIGEHASLGMDESAMVRPHSLSELDKAVRDHSQKLGKACFAERFISGREFNISLLADGDTCQPLPVAEIDFSKFPDGKLRIVDYKAKWDTESFEFQHTPRRFLSENEDTRLAEELRHLACRCWSTFQLGGYVRVDFRVDEDGNPWILEINTNPCLSPDAGYMAALRQASIPFPTAIRRIIEQAVSQQSRAGDSKFQLADDNARPVRGEKSAIDEIGWRDEVTMSDSQSIRDLVAATGFFNGEEIAIAQELVDERLNKGPASGYQFVIAEATGKLAGYACYGPIAGTRDSYDLYWIAVAPEFQGRGVGRMILDQAEKHIRAAGGGKVYIETSDRDQYRSTRGFYTRCGYIREATLAGFYGPGDDKVIYVKRVDG